eukprot:478422-Alexandrium_andersonii.AAC.1
MVWATWARRTTHSPHRAWTFSLTPRRSRLSLGRAGAERRGPLQAARQLVSKRAAGLPRRAPA